MKRKPVSELIYTRCKDECPLETVRMAKVQRLLGDQMGKDIFSCRSASIPKKTR